MSFGIQLFNSSGTLTFDSSVDLVETVVATGTLTIVNRTAGSVYPPGGVTAGHRLIVRRRAQTVGADWDTAGTACQYQYQRFANHFKIYNWNISNTSITVDWVLLRVQQ